jgi:hypothetical protein
MPEFKEKEIQREKEKMEELEPYLKQAMTRKKWMAELKDDEIPDIEALGRKVIAESKIKEETDKKKKTTV